MLTALITGASRGLGRAMAEQLAAAGARVALVARGRDDLERVAAGIRARGGEVYAIAADVGERDSAWRIAGEAHAQLGSVDLLVHDASTLGETPLPLLADAAPDDVERTFQVNVLGPFRLTQALVGAMVLRGGGTVAAISSDAAVQAYGRWGAYGASKAALDHLLRIWAAELSGSGVSFLSIDPGEMDTAMHAAAMPETDPATLADPAAVAARIVPLLLRQRAAASGTRLVAAELAP